MLENNRATNRAPFGELNLNLGKAKSLQQHIVKQGKDKHFQGYQVEEDLAELEFKNENLVGLVEKLLNENSRYENSFLAIKSSQFKLLAINKKLCQVVKYLKGQLNAFRRKETKTEALYKFFKGACLNRASGDIVLQQSTLKRVFEIIEQRNSNSDIVVYEPVELKPSLNGSFIYTI